MAGQWLVRPRSRSAGRRKRRRQNRLAQFRSSPPNLRRHAGKGPDLWPSGAASAVGRAAIGTPSVRPSSVQPWHRSAPDRWPWRWRSAARRSSGRPSGNRPAVAVAIAARVEPVAGQVALERLVGLAVDEADDPVGRTDLRIWTGVGFSISAFGAAALALPAVVRPATASRTLAIRGGSSAGGRGLFAT